MRLRDLLGLQGDLLESVIPVQGHVASSVVEAAAALCRSLRAILSKRLTARRALARASILP